MARPWNVDVRRLPVSERGLAGPDASEEGPSAASPPASREEEVGILTIN